MLHKKGILMLEKILLQDHKARERSVEIYRSGGFDPSIPYRALYFHDGQNIFDAEDSYAGISWNVHRALEALGESQILAVGIWNSPERWQEYMPQKIFEQFGNDESFIPQADAYLGFLNQTVIPQVEVDGNPPSERFILGSSMGALVSLYALHLYGEVFDGAACLSPHWPAFEGISAFHVEKMLPDPDKRIYFDYGTEGLDAHYETYQFMVNKVFDGQGLSYLCRKFEGHDHHESYWADRVAIPLRYLLKI
jgi:predicted alpha/beta superfamily hydrolase